MGYFKIGKYKIFYSDDRFAEINKPFLEKLSAHEMIGMKILGFDGKPNKNARELEALQMNKLKEDFKLLSLQHFLNKWVEFEFSGEMAKQLSWEIIYDYFDVNRNGYIEDVRDFEEKLIDDYNGQDYLFPQGQVVKLNFKLSAGKNILAQLFSTKKTLTKNIDLTRIECIKGSLKALEITTDREMIKLKDSIEIINYSSQQKYL